MEIHDVAVKCESLATEIHEVAVKATKLAKIVLGMTIATFLAFIGIITFMFTNVPDPVRVNQHMHKLNEVHKFVVNKPATRTSE